MPDTAPLTHVIEARIPATSTAGDDAEFVAGVAPFAATVTAVHYIPAAAIAGHASNNRALSVINKGAAGTGTTSVATVTTNASTSLAAFAARALALSATAAHKVVADGDVLAFKSDANATGVADPGGVVRIVLSRD